MLNSFSSAQGEEALKVLITMFPSGNWDNVCKINITLYSKHDHLISKPCLSSEDDEETWCSFGNGELVTFYRQWSFGDSVPTSPAVDNKVYW